MTKMIISWLNHQHRYAHRVRLCQRPTQDQEIANILFFKQRCLLKLSQLAWISFLGSLLGPDTLCQRFWIVCFGSPHRWRVCVLLFQARIHRIYQSSLSVSFFFTLCILWYIFFLSRRLLLLSLLYVGMRLISNIFSNNPNWANQSVFWSKNV